MFFKRLRRKEKKGEEEDKAKNVEKELVEDDFSLDFAAPLPIPEPQDVLADMGEFWYDTGKRYVLGKEQGMEVAQDMGRGIDCIRRSADLGHDAAKWDLQCFVGEGDELHLDFSKAVVIYKKYAKENHPMALSNLGVCYHKGRGVPKDVPKSIKLYERAVSQHYARATYNLAVCYDLGEGVKTDIPHAVELYLKAAKGGYAVAQYYMGVCYFNGKGLAGSAEDKAVEMWQRAADQGHAFAQFSLGQCYRDSRAVKEDLLKAARYFIGHSRSGAKEGWQALLALLYKVYKEGGQPVRYFYERELKVEEIFMVTRLYDQLCLNFHKKWEREGVEGRKEEQDKLPAEVRERVKYRATHCVQPQCKCFFYGSGRVERRYVLRKEAGGTEQWDDDVVLSFCSVKCARFETVVPNIHKALDPL